MKATEIITTNRSHRTVFAGVLGAFAVAGGLAALSITASADSPPSLAPTEDVSALATTTTTTGPSEGAITSFGALADEEDWAAFDECIADAGGYEEFEDDAGHDAHDAAYGDCSSLLPEEVRAENAMWEAYHSCIDEILGSNFWDEPNFDEAAYEAAEDSCLGLLPEAIQEEMRALAAYEDCQSEFAGDHPSHGSVSVNGTDSWESFAFGESDATITITKVDGEVNVSVDGDVVVQDDAYWEAEEARWLEAEKVCGHLLPGGN